MKGMPLEGIPPFWFKLSYIAGKSLDEVAEMTYTEAFAHVENYNENGHVFTNEIIHSNAQIACMIFNSNIDPKKTQPLAPKDFIPRLSKPKIEIDSNEATVNRLRTQLRGL